MLNSAEPAGPLKPLNRHSYQYQEKSAASLHMKPGALPRGNPRLPATARTSHRTATRALHTRSKPSAHALRPSVPHAHNFLAQPSQQPAHIAHTQTTLAQHVLPRHRTSPPLRASPAPGPYPPSPTRGSASPPPSRRPALPANLYAFCSADSSSAYAASAAAARRPQPNTCLACRARRTGSRNLTRAAPRVPASLCREAQAARAYISWAGLGAQQCSAAALGSGSTLALQHTCIAGTHALQHTLGRCYAAVDLYPDLQERGWDGHHP